MREVAAELERPVLLFSGGKDSIVLLRLAEKAFRPARFPFPLMHVDTGHNFPEVIEFRDRRVAELGERLIVARVQDSIDAGRVVEETGPRASRNRLQTTTLLDAIAEHGFDAAFGGARRDEERARAKERIMSFRDDFGGWDPKAQRPELWNLYNGRIRKGEHVRVFPLSNWTELDVWQYIEAEDLEVPVDLLRPRARGLPPRRDALRGLRRTCSSSTARRPSPRACATARSATCRAPAPSPRPRSRWRTSWPRSRRPRSPSAARRAPTTRSPRPRWRTARLPVTSEPPAAPRHGRHRVDDGKSTLIGRLLHDAKAILADQLDDLRGRDGELDLSRLTDGLRAEREQGITIDVAYRYFATARRTFILADTPGHVQYTRNMVTGASTADLAIVLVDARNGVVEQTRRHAFIASLLGIPHLVVAVNKMDLVDYSEEAFDAVVRDFCAFRSQLAVRDTAFVPISALLGDNVVERSEAMPWYGGLPLLEHLETVEVAGRPQPRPSCASRCSTSSATATSDYRGYAGQVAGGVLRPGDEVLVLPSERATHRRLDRHARRAARRGLPADERDRPPGRRRSTSRAATSSAAPATARPSPAT